jgi:uncharacterized membrane protein
VLELKPPHLTTWPAIRELVPDFLSYIMSFIMIGIYWGNHHHLLHTLTHVNSKMIWANLHLLFWLSLIPFATAWMGQNNFDKVTVATYATLLDLCGLAYYILLHVIERHRPADAKMAYALQKQSRKGLISTIAYSVSIGAAFVHPLIAGAIFIGVALLWWWPDRNIERSVKHEEEVTLSS